jgi:predicted extracellular nuclease
MSRFAHLILVLVSVSACVQQPPAPIETGLDALDADVTTELYFSQYIEGSSNNKALEIFNGTSDAVDLGGYRVQMYFNGSSGAGRIIDLVGMLAAGETHVLAHGSAVQEILDAAQQTNSESWFNGNDSVVLVRNGAIVDSLGRIGEDPGSQWGSGLASTANNTLRRTAAVCGGDTDATDPFDPAVGWEGFEENSFDGLGEHATDCVPGAHFQPEPQPDPDGITRIYHIQGSADDSPTVNETVTVRGVVVGDFQRFDELSGFFVQEQVGDGREDTSDGIFVFNRNSDVSVGDEIEVTGRVVEFFGLTELTDVSTDDVVVIGNGTVPSPTRVDLPLPAGESWERYEGMLVNVRSATGPLVATEVFHLGRGGLVTLADERLVQFTQTSEPSVTGYAEHRSELERRTIILDDGTTRQNPDPIRYSATGSELTANDTLRVGDTVSEVTGVLTYSFNGWSRTDAYRVHPTEPVELVASNPRPRTPPQVGGSVQVASFNVLNFFNGDGLGDGFPTSRGADDEFELDRQRAKLVNAITRLDAEVLGFIEIENDDGPNSALAELVAALNAQAGAGTYDYIDTGVIGTDAIKVALAYRAGAVTPVGRYRILNSSREDAWHTLDPRFDDSLNRPALAQTFVVNATGARFTVVVNHLKSKGSSCSGDGDAGDGQGNCNGTRTAAAAALADWAELLAQQSGDPDVLITGDLNAYAAEDPVRLLESAGFENLLARGAWTYVFRGESGTLDHALATSSLAGQVTAAAAWHINAEEPSVLDYNDDFKSERHIELLYADSPFRSSDHDPVIVGLEPYPAASPAGEQ